MNYTEPFPNTVNVIALATVMLIVFTVVCIKIMPYIGKLICPDYIIAKANRANVYKARYERLEMNMKREALIIDRLNRSTSPKNMKLRAKLEKRQIKFKRILERLNEVYIMEHEEIKALCKYDKANMNYHTGVIVD